MLTSSALPTLSQTFSDRKGWGGMQSATNIISLQVWYLQTCCLERQSVACARRCGACWRAMSHRRCGWRLRRRRVTPSRCRRSRSASWPWACAPWPSLAAALPSPSVCLKTRVAFVAGLYPQKILTLADDRAKAVSWFANVKDSADHMSPTLSKATKPDRQSNGQAVAFGLHYFFTKNHVVHCHSLSQGGR